MRKQRRAEVFRITGARTALTDDVRGRQRRYVISMSIRTVSFLAAVLLWRVWSPVAWIALVLGLVLPYVAVVLANAGRENAPSLPPSFIPPAARRPLGSGRPRPDSGTDSDSATDSGTAGARDAEGEERRYTGHS